MTVKEVEEGASAEDRREAKDEYRRALARQCYGIFAREKTDGQKQSNKGYPAPEQGGALRA